MASGPAPADDGWGEPQRDWEPSPPEAGPDPSMMALQRRLQACGGGGGAGPGGGGAPPALLGEDGVRRLPASVAAPFVAQAAPGRRLDPEAAKEKLLEEMDK